MNIVRVDYDNIINGPGERAVLWVQGCEHHCKGCHNPQTWSHDEGREFTVEDYNEIRQYLLKDYVDGITISGGDPLSTKNRSEVLRIAFNLKRDTGKSIWIYTGYRWENLMDKLSYEQQNILISSVDVLIDGKFIEEKKIDGEYRGSFNQRLIDVKKTSHGSVELWQSEFGGQ